MERRDEEHRVRRFFASRLFLLVCLVVIFFVALSYARAYYQDYKVREEIAQLNEEVKTLERKKIESLDILTYVTSDAFVEEKARTELNMKKPGEHVIFIEGEKNRLAGPSGSVAGEKIATPLRNPVKWWYYFLHKAVPE